MNVRILVTATLVWTLSTFTFAQETTEPASSWDVGGDANVTFFQSSFTNWTDGGGDPTTSIGILGNLFAKYKKDKLSWSNNLLLQYNIQKVGQDADFVKSIDKLELLSVAGLYAVENWDYSMLFSAKTQLTNTEVDGVLQSKFFAPGEIILAPGMKYAQGTKDTRTNTLVNISPATARWIIVADDDLAATGTFTGIPGERAKFEFGASIIGTYRVNVTNTENSKITYFTGLELFSNYLENPENIDVKWTNLFSANFLKFLTVTFATDLRYDADVAVPIDDNNDGTPDRTGPRTRWAQTFGVGLGYKF